ncbi:hypothetical protein BX667DRAFT_203253 [Coemansia mojavensis]|nr:hypothetical protein BX667DRAFT_203253 [Coemansia mojavensis]
MHTPVSTGGEQVRRTRSLKRRSQGPVRKGDIRIVAGSTECSPAKEFKVAQSTGSGDGNDLCFQRLQAWQNVVENHHEYFQSMAAAERDLATVYARIGDILKEPADASLLLLPANANGVHSLSWRLKTLQQEMVETHVAISDTLKSRALSELDQLRSDIVAMRQGYAEAVQGLHQQLKQGQSTIAKRTQLLEAAIEAAHDEHDRETVKDPFIINLEVAALLRKQAETADRLKSACKEQQAAMREFEPQIIERLQKAVNAFLDISSHGYRQLQQTMRQDICAIAEMDSETEWAGFRQSYGPVLDSVLGSEAPDTEYAGKHSAWVRVLRQGVVALKEHGPLFRSTWQSKYGVLTTRGYFHVFRSQGDVVRGAPETSIFLPRARIADGAGGVLQISCGGRFSRSRIIIQDGTASLENWRMLMETARAGASSSGLATPESSADEASPVACERAVIRRSGPPERSRRMSVLAASATPTRGRPFSADVSMLQTPPPFARGGQRVSFTPTQDIFMQPLDSTPVSPPGFERLPCLSPIIAAGDSAEFAAYSPGFSESPALGRESSDDMLESTTRAASSSSSGAPHQPESLFDRNMSQDSESAPIASLPQLQRPRKHANSFQEPFPGADIPDIAPRVVRELGCDTSVHSAEPMRRGASIVDLQSPRLCSSTSGLVAHSYSQDIWRPDLLSVPDPASQLAMRQRPRSMIYPSGDAVLDPHNPYLGEFLAKRNVFDTRVGSRASSASIGQQTTLWRSGAGSALGMLHPRVVSQPSEPGPASASPL